LAQSVELVPVSGNINRTVFLDKNRTMDNVQKHNISARLGMSSILNGLSKIMKNVFEKFCIQLNVNPESEEPFCSKMIDKLFLVVEPG
jgi:hypothetical protein